jgi:hypothetical protein
MRSTVREALPVLGVGAAACAACCVGPLVAAVAALSVGGVALRVGGSLLLAVLLAVAVAALVGTRRRRAHRAPDGPVPVPLTRSSTTTG